MNPVIQPVQPSMPEAIKKEENKVDSEKSEPVKETKEKEDTKPKDKTRPVSSAPVPGTPW